MSKKLTKTKNALKLIVALSMLFNLAVSQTKSSNVLDLFDGVVNVDASTGNISPSIICSSRGYSQELSTPTLNNLTVQTNLNTSILLNQVLIDNNLIPAKTSTSFATSYLCPQNNPNFGTLSGTVGDASRQLGIRLSNTSYSPPVGFKGLACFSAYYEYNEGQPTSIEGSTNVAQVKIQVGGSTSTTCGPDPVTGTVGDPFPSFWVELSDGFVDPAASFTPFGSNKTIRGLAGNNLFTPYPGQTIPSDITLGVSSGILVTGSDGISTIATNFSPRPSSGGGVITINTTSNSSLVSSAQNPSSISSTSTIFSYDASKNQIAAPKISGKSAKAETLNIEDPFDCKIGIYGDVKYSGDYKNLNPIKFTVTDKKDSTKVYNFTPKLNSKGEYYIAYDLIPKGKFIANFEVSTKDGQYDSGTYEFENACEKVSQNSKIGVANKTAKNSSDFNLPRTGGSQTGFLYALALVLFTIFISSQICSSKIED